MNRHQLAHRFVLELDAILDTLIARNLGGIEAVRLFNIRMRTYEALPARVRRQIPTPWHLEAG